MSLKNNNFKNNFYFKKTQWCITFFNDLGQISDITEKKLYGIAESVF